MTKHQFGDCVNCDRTETRLGHAAKRWCRACHARWLRAGKPPEGPPAASSRRSRTRNPGPENSVPSPEKTADGVIAAVSAAAVARISGSGPAPRLTLDWQSAAACAGADLDSFFPESGEHGTHPRVTCAQCPVIAECLTWALLFPEAHGIWGGTTAQHRFRLRADIAHRSARPPVAQTTDREHR